MTATRYIALGLILLVALMLIYVAVRGVGGAPPTDLLTFRDAPRVFAVRVNGVEHCPIRSLSPGHYRGDGSCHCAAEGITE